MYELRRLKRYGFVNLGRYATAGAAVYYLQRSVTEINDYNTNTLIYHGKDGFTYEIKYV